MNQGILFFRTIADALRAGYHVYDRCLDGSHLVRTKLAAGWALAVVLAPTA